MLYITKILKNPKWYNQISLFQKMTNLKNSRLDSHEKLLSVLLNMKNAFSKQIKVIYKI